MPTPTTGVSIAVFRNGRVLLARRAREPYRDFWSLPGGKQRTGETLEEAARRELAEETALSAGALAFVRFHEPMRRGPDGAVLVHYVLAVFAAIKADGEPAAGDDAAELAWCARHELDAYRLTPNLPAIIGAAAERVDTKF